MLIMRAPLSLEVRRKGKKREKRDNLVCPESALNYPYNFSYRHTIFSILKASLVEHSVFVFKIVIGLVCLK